MTLAANMLLSCLGSAFYLRSWVQGWRRHGAGADHVARGPQRLRDGAAGRALAVPGGLFLLPRDGVMEQARRPNFRGLVLGGIDADFYR